ncbi:hypothetical protein SY88_18380 [Clostridiales bacterium PH28_bin88]|nr:hypothetical protein SY88_18380 [Clostridiales bacterium PH28_bin88]
MGCEVERDAKSIVHSHQEPLSDAEGKERAVVPVKGRGNLRSPREALVRREAALAGLVMEILLVWAILLRPPVGAELETLPETVKAVPAPWVFGGIQWLLELWPPWMAGVLLPAMGLLMLVMVPFVARRMDRVARLMAFGIIGLMVMLTLLGHILA